MRSFIQVTDTNNNILRSLSLGDLSTGTTYSFRVWNNLAQEVGIRSLNGLKLDLMYPPKQGIKTLVNEDSIKIRCTYSGERSEAVSMNFQSFPISGENFNRLELNTYNEYEVQIDFTVLSVAQKAAVDLIDMEFNITATYDTDFVPFSLPQELLIISDTIILVVKEMTVTSDTTIA